MNNPLAGLGDAQKSMQQAQQLQAALQKEEVTVERNGIKVTVRGDQQIMAVEVDGIVENRIADAINEAVKQTQQLAATKLKDIMQK